MLQGLVLLVAFLPEIGLRRMYISLGLSSRSLSASTDAGQNRRRLVTDLCRQAAQVGTNAQPIRGLPTIVLIHRSVI